MPLAEITRDEQHIQVRPTSQIAGSGPSSRTHWRSRVDLIGITGPLLSLCVGVTVECVAPVWDCSPSRIGKYPSRMASSNPALDLEHFPARPKNIFALSGSKIVTAHKD